MSNRYWRKRIAEEMEQAQKRDMNRQREMQRLYDEALEELQLTIDGLFQRYANKEGLNLAQAKKRASAMDLNIFNRRVKRWVEERDFSLEANKHLKLYNLKGKVSRLELMKQHMKLATAQLAGREEAYVRESLHDEAIRQREIQSGIFGLYAPDSDQFRQQANAIINTPFQGGSWSKRIWERQDQLANFLNSAIQRIIMQGKHSTTFQSEVRKKFNSTAYEAKRLLVTETARVQTEVQRQTMEDNGFSQYEYMAEPTACHICKPLDGQIFKVSDMEPGTNAAPMHPNCKCSSAPYESREDLEDMFDAIAEGRGDEFFSKMVQAGAKYYQRDISDDFLKSNEKIKQEKFAYMQYNAIKNRQANREIEKIYRNFENQNLLYLGINKQQIKRAFHHVFIKKHQLTHKYGWFDPDYDMAQSWTRLIDGKEIYPHDVILIQHEAYEAILMDEKNMSYEEAHIETEKYFNYNNSVKQFKKGGDS
ncbi:minor capsid protein [Dolosigranulum pigrum]|uniref:minor capsid protein n=1 Tax=Dolosigranulum pigrum TaxID=29394 RepID=UPI0015EB6DD6|nr:minor capsid protein [Dolosigranulum pigrum]